MTVTVYCGSNDGADPKYARCAREFGALIAQKGHDLVYGGGKTGLMGIVADSCLEAGGRVVGVEPRFLVEREVAHLGLTELILVDTMHERKAEMMRRGDMFVTLPGGVGTLEEISEIITLAMLRRIDKPYYIVSLDGFYDMLGKQLDVMTAEGFLTPENRSMIRFVPDVEDVFEDL